MDRFGLIGKNNSKSAGSTIDVRSRDLLAFNPVIVEQRLQTVLVRCLAADASRGYRSLQADLVQLILDNGIPCVPQRRPRGYRRRPTQSPFLSAFLDFTYLPDAGERVNTYVEGIAWTDDGRTGCHAWVIDRECRVIDRTLERPDLCHYFGVPLDAKAICRLSLDEFKSVARSVLQHLIVTGRAGDIEEYRSHLFDGVDLASQGGPPVDRFQDIARRFSE